MTARPRPRTASALADDPVAQPADAVDLNLDDIAITEQQRRLTAEADARRGAGEDERSPGSSAVNSEIVLTRVATSKIISSVDDSCTTWPLTVVRSVSRETSGISSAVTSHGPTGVEASHALPCSH